MNTRAVFALVGALAGLFAALLPELVFGVTGTNEWLARRGQRVLLLPDPARPSSNETRGVRTGTGDVQVTLTWNNENDLDLHVTDPAGERIYFSHRRAASGGELDVDMNAGGGPFSSRAVENVFWGFNTAPAGRYQVSVAHFRNNGSPDPTPFTVRVLNKGRVQTTRGGISAGDERQPATSFSVATGPSQARRALTWNPAVLAAAGVVGAWGALVGGLLAFALSEGQNQWSRRRFGWPTLAPGQIRRATAGGALAGLVAGLVSQTPFGLLAGLDAPGGAFSGAVRLLFFTLLGGLIGAALGALVPNLPRRPAALAGAIAGFGAAVLLLLAFGVSADVPGRMLGAMLIGAAIGAMITLPGDGPGRRIGVRVAVARPQRVRPDRVGSARSPNAAPRRTDEPQRRSGGGRLGLLRSRR